MDVHRFGTGPILEDSRVVRTFALTLYAPSSTGELGI